MSNIVKKFGGITVGHKASIGELSLTKLSATQLTAITSGVTLNSPAGSITTVSSTLATQASTSFSVTNSYVSPSSVVLASIIDYGGSNGTPSIIVDNITQGNFSVVLRNSHTVNPLNGTVKIGYTLL